MSSVRCSIIRRLKERIIIVDFSVTLVGVAGRKDEPQPWMPVYARNQSFTNIFELIC